MSRDRDEVRKRNGGAVIPVSREDTRSPERAQAMPDAWWIPHDPISQRKLVTVLAKMAKYVLDRAEEPLSESSEGEALDRHGCHLEAAHLNKS